MMVKETKFFRKQADNAERMARSVIDDEISQRYLNLARAYRSQADVLKAKKKAERNSTNPQSLNARGCHEETDVSCFGRAPFSGLAKLHGPQSGTDWMPAQQVIEK